MLCSIQSQNHHVGLPNLCRALSCTTKSNWTFLRMQKIGQSRLKQQITILLSKAKQIKFRQKFSLWDQQHICNMRSHNKASSLITLWGTQSFGIRRLWLEIRPLCHCTSHRVLEHPLKSYPQESFCISFPTAA